MNRVIHVFSLGFDRQHMNKLNLLSIPLCLTFLVGVQSYSLADTFSKPGIEVTVSLPNGLFSRTEIGNISGSYKARNTEGILFDAPQVSSSLGESDIALFNFVDTKGQDRCYGLTSISSGGVNVWKVKGSVPGYRCSSVGKSYRFNFGR
jgi:hypothetical protein